MICSVPFKSGSGLVVVSRRICRATSSCFGSSPGPGGTKVREIHGPCLLVPITFFFSAACAEKLRETTTNAAMTPTTPLLSCVMGLSSNLLAWSLLLKCTPCECGCEIGRGSLHQRLPYRLHPSCPPLAWWRD